MQIKYDELLFPRQYFFRTIEIMTKDFTQKNFFFFIEKSIVIEREIVFPFFI